MGVSEEVMAWLMEYDYPGNVRELENIIEHAFALCNGDLVECRHLPPEHRPGNTPAEDVPAFSLKAMEEALI